LRGPLLAHDLNAQVGAPSAPQGIPHSIVRQGDRTADWGHATVVSESIKRLAAAGSSIGGAVLALQKTTVWFLNIVREGQSRPEGLGKRSILEFVSHVRGRSQERSCSNAASRADGELLLHRGRLQELCMGVFLNLSGQMLLQTLGST
jgi:hypothetical protein